MYILTVDSDRYGCDTRVGGYVYNAHEIATSRLHMYTEIDMVVKEREPTKVFTESEFRRVIDALTFANTEALQDYISYNFTLEE